MNHEPILQAALVLPADHQLGTLRQTKRLSALIAELNTMEPGAPGAAETLHEAHNIAQSLFTECSTHPNGGRPDRWYLATVKTLNTCAARHGLEPSPMPFALNG